MPPRTQGSQTLEAMIAEGSLVRAQCGTSQARDQLDQASTHLRAAREHEGQPVAVTLAYEACRQALTALLTAQGLAVADSGGELACYEAAMAQFEDHASQWRTFNRLRQLRATAPATQDASELDGATDLISTAAKLVPDLEPY